MFTLNAYVEKLQQFVKDHPECGNMQPVITEHGYYATSEFSEMWETPEVQKFKVAGKSKFIPGTGWVEIEPTVYEEKIVLAYSYRGG